MKALSALFIVAALGLGGCKDGGADRQAASQPPARTVAFFLEHPDEHETVKRRCKNDPGALRSTPDCVNADQAQKQIFVWGRDEAVKRSREGS